ncbi:RNA polymerase sigma factor, sigma-70 family [Marininema mesophilum]|uniref:RNA polymerase sigma factor, sigma-70 family n=2 Tax=Marininema mesophilum TaxID=1048340 RepID=A0A1H3B8I4_9BACL|nr:RNA polymerase sigma factor, sigma-70 family [Marininema mesophilum]
MLYFKVLCHKKDHSGVYKVENREWGDEMVGVMSIGEDEASTSEVEGFEGIFKRYYSYVVRQVMRIIPAQSVAEDIAQEIFIRLYHVDRSEIENIEAWLAKSATNGAYNYIRSEKRHRARIEKERQQAEKISQSAEIHWINQEEIESVRKALILLSERDRNLLLLKFEGFNYEELAQIIQVKKESVGTLLTRAKERFRSLYFQRKEEEQDCTVTSKERYKLT